MNEEQPGERLFLDQVSRLRIWRDTGRAIEEYFETVGARRVSPQRDVLSEIEACLGEVNLERGIGPADACELALRGLNEWQTHVSHPRYFGLFVPPSSFMGIIGDAIAAAFNPQLANWTHSPFAIAVERRLVQELARLFGYPIADAVGTFTSGGSEANFTGMLLALIHRFPQFAIAGARGCIGRPSVYVSREAHNSWVKAARACGIGSDAVRVIGVTPALRIDMESLASQIAADRATDWDPFLVVGTAGTTAAGIVDPLDDLADFARAQGMWFHVDAAWGGAVAISGKLRVTLAGLERSDSLTFDAHKWLSIPMGAGVFLTTHPETLERAFSVETAYMPPRSSDGQAEPYVSSAQWSRRFIGLKMFLTLASIGWEGYAREIERQIELADVLRGMLIDDDWTILNETVLPVVCFSDGGVNDTATDDSCHAIVDHVLTSGHAWVSVAVLGDGRSAIRACISGMRTGPDDLKILLKSLHEARSRVPGAKRGHTQAHPIGLDSSR